MRVEIEKVANGFILTPGHNPVNPNRTGMNADIYVFRTLSELHKWLQDNFDNQRKQKVNNENVQSKS